MAEFQDSFICRALTFALHYCNDLPGFQRNNEEKIMKKPSRYYVLAFMIFIVMNLLFTIGKAKLEQWGLDQSVLLIGNLFLFAITIFTFFLHKKAMDAPTTAAFIRYVYMAMFGKLILCALAASIYIIIAQQAVNNYSLLICLLLYILYTFSEVRNLMSVYKQRKNAG